MKLAIAISACFTAFLLSGCVDQKAQDAANEVRCTKYGVPPGSSGFADCMLRAAELDALEGDLQARRLQAAGAAIQGATAAMRTSQPPTLNCTSVQTGNVTNTNCH